MGWGTQRGNPKGAKWRGTGALWSRYIPLFLVFSFSENLSNKENVCTLDPLARSILYIWNCLINRWVIWRWLTWGLHSGAVWNWVGTHLDRGRGCASFGWGWDPRVVNPGISLCFLVLNLLGYSLAISWLCLTFVTDLSLLFSFQGMHLLHEASLLCVEAVALQKVELAVAGSKAEGLYGLYTRCPVPFSHTDGPNPSQEVSMNPHHHYVKTTPQEPESVDPESFIPVPEGVHRHRRPPPWHLPRLCRLPTLLTWHPFI